MRVSLSDAPRKFVEEKVRFGQHGSANAVIEAALDALSQLQSHTIGHDAPVAIDRAEEQSERGEVHNWKDVREQVRKNFMSRK